MHDDATNKSGPGSHDRCTFESDFLSRESADAKAAIGEAIDRLKETLKDSADVEAWARRYPWPSVGVAAALGFVAAAALTPSSRDRERKRWAEMLHEAHAGAPAGPAAASGSGGGGAKSMLGSLAMSLVQSVAPVIQSAIIAAVTAKAREATAEPSHNGHEEPAFPEG